MFDRGTLPISSNTAFRSPKATSEAKIQQRMILYLNHYVIWRCKAKIRIGSKGKASEGSSLCSQVVMVNSSWTKKHIRQLWWKLDEARRVFPPCNTKSLQSLPLQRRLKRLYLVSVAQFRPEKDHALQLESLALARKNASREGGRTGEPVLFVAAS